MAKIDYTFEISISPSGTEYIDFQITKKEARYIAEAMEEGYPFEDTENLQALYKRVYKAAREKLAEDIKLTGNDPDVNHSMNAGDLDFAIDFTDYPDEE